MHERLKPAPLVSKALASLYCVRPETCSHGNFRLMSSELILLFSEDPCPLCPQTYLYPRGTARNDEKTACLIRNMDGIKWEPALRLWAEGATNYKCLLAT